MLTRVPNSEKKFKKNYTIKQYDDGNKDTSNALQVYVLVDENDKELAKIVKKDGKLSESLASTDAQESGLFADFAKDCGIKEEDIIYTKSLEASVQMTKKAEKEEKLSKSSKIIACLKKASKSSKKDKPFQGYDPKKHSKTGGLNDKARKKINKEEGSNLKRPVTEDNPGPKAAARKKSFCARMSGVKGPTSKEGELTPKGAALKRWKCSKSEEEALEKAKENRCWDGYKPTPGKKAYSKGSCVKKSAKIFASLKKACDTLKKDDEGGEKRKGRIDLTQIGKPTPPKPKAAEPVERTIDYSKFNKPKADDSSAPTLDYSKMKAPTQEPKWKRDASAKAHFDLEAAIKRAGGLKKPTGNKEANDAALKNKDLNKNAVMGYPEMGGMPPLAMSKQESLKKAIECLKKKSKTAILTD